MQWLFAPVGVLLGALCAWGIVQVMPDASVSMDWLDDNFGLSVYLFIAIGVCFCIALSGLHEALSHRASSARIAQKEMLVDNLSSAFLAVGVIWTAIGMRGALVNGLGDMDSQLVGQGPFVLLQRLVEGGILTALSTTIAGAIGSHVMRQIKHWRVGYALQKRAFDDHHEVEREILRQLILIRRQLNAEEEQPVTGMNPIDNEQHVEDPMSSLRTQEVAI